MGLERGISNLKPTPPSRLALPPTTQHTQPHSKQASQRIIMPPPSSRRPAIRITRRQPALSSSIVVLALFCISTTAFVFSSPSSSSQTTPPHHHQQQQQQRPNPSILPALHRLLQSSPSLLLFPFAASLGSAPLPALAVAAPAPQTTTTTKAAAANLPADVIATAVISLGKNANVHRLLLPPSPSSSTTTTSTTTSSSPQQGQQEPSSPALYVTARVGSRGRVLASIKLPLQSLPSPAFPASVQIKESDIYADTPEAQHTIAQEIQMSDLFLSARLDRDGQASTRSPEDLVGQGVMYKFKAVDSAQWSRADVVLTGRGAFGEFVTGGKGK